MSSLPTKPDSKRKEAMIQALAQTLGVVTTACKKVGINRDTHYRWYNTDPDYKAACDDTKNIAVDFAESQLHKQIQEGNAASTIFFLKCQGKQRGYVERQELDVSGGMNITWNETKTYPNEDKL